MKNIWSWNICILFCNTRRFGLHKTQLWNIDKYWSKKHGKWIAETFPFFKNRCKILLQLDEISRFDIKKIKKIPIQIDFLKSSLLLSASLQTQQYASMNKIFLHQKLFNASNWKVVSDHRQFFDYLWDQLSFIYDCCRVTSPASVQYVSPFSEITQIHTINHIFTK